jgi:imidazoleglycerol phosphate dehydratase HisB
MLELSHGMATMVHWATSDLVSNEVSLNYCIVTLRVLEARCIVTLIVIVTQGKQDVVAIASRVASVSHSMATAVRCRAGQDLRSSHGILIAVALPS